MLIWSLQIVQRYGVVGCILAGIAALILIGCSTDTDVLDTEEDLSYLEDLEELKEKGPKPPSWSKGYFTIEVGRFQTGPELLEELTTRKLGPEYWATRYFVDKTGSIHSGVHDLLSHPEFPMAGRRYTIKVAVLSMLDAGMNGGFRMDDILKRYKELGYRPLTMEEAVELRLQFTDQPFIQSGHEMSQFDVLPSDNKRDLDFLEKEMMDYERKEVIAWKPENAGKKFLNWPPIFSLIAKRANDQYGTGHLGIVVSTLGGSLLFYPHHEQMFGQKVDGLFIRGRFLVPNPPKLVKFAGVIE